MPHRVDMWKIVMVGKVHQMHDWQLESFVCLQNALSQITVSRDLDSWFDVYCQRALSQLALIISTYSRMKINPSSSLLIGYG